VTKLPDWLVERAALDEVPAASRDRIANADPIELESRVAALRAENADELAKYPAVPALEQIETRVASAKRKRRAKTFGALGLAVAGAAAVFFVARSPQPSTPRDDREITRIKGTAHLLVFRQHGSGAEVLRAEAEVHPGDVLQLRYNPGPRGYGMIASIDGAGAVTLHFPADEAASTAMKSATTTLPEAYALDAAPKFERFFFITADSPIDVAVDLARLRELAARDDAADAALALPPGESQWSMRLKKANP